MDIGRVALQRGPLVYCLEEVDNPAARCSGFKLPRNAELKSTTRSDLFDGIVTISAGATAIGDAGWTDALYRNNPPDQGQATLTAIALLPLGQSRRGLHGRLGSGGLEPERPRIGRFGGGCTSSGGGDGFGRWRCVRLAGRAWAGRLLAQRREIGRGDSLLLKQQQCSGIQIAAPPFEHGLCQRRGLLDQRPDGEVDLALGRLRRADELVLRDWRRGMAAARGA